MLKKNSSQIRFNTAGARIPMSRKLPSDFFKPQSALQSKQIPNFVLIQKNTNQLSISKLKPNDLTKDSQQFTFRRSNSQQHHSLHQNIGTKKYFWSKRMKQHKKSQMKLPPIINFSVLRQTNESAKKFVMKLTKKTAKKISQQFWKARQKQNVQL